MSESTQAAACAWQPAANKKNNYNKRFSTGELPVEPNRYTLVWGPFCPWATPVSMLIDLLGLNTVIGKSPVFPLRHSGVDNDWFFGKKDSDEDPILKTNRLSNLCRNADPTFNDRAAVPTLVDIKSGKAVNNDSGILLTELATTWKAYETADAPDVFPEDKQAEILGYDQKIIDNLSNVINTIGDVTSQSEYDKLSTQFFDQLSEFDTLLAHRDFLLGDSVTISDLLLFARLIRFDLVFYFQNKLNQQRLEDFPNLWRYAKQCYALPAFKNNTDFTAIKQHFIQGSIDVHDFAHVLPAGPDTRKWTE
ncbi:glutathione S-transferase C-terminal domain-containing protein [Secundilactobacillus collinoides]|uniref:Glutathione S-transferase domain protein n=1 Tax=Secundilactobacillus collinoides DSM 20515 = JCM 1123 TaxID=1423733 RepID=A0A0R2B438_SECCO|nr:glutathione S-transferase C-terminal domain-containing protein [Secundilactobacillus collinoides]KRM73850.1 glutathione S-transferase domain protein [Secundilactobacillus collinoides DSM 20515 = JCM 1123]